MKAFSLQNFDTSLEFVSTLTTKGQVTIPAPIRKTLKVKPHDRVAFHLAKDKVYLTHPTYTLETIKGAVPKLKKPYSEKELREIALESRLRKYQKP